MNCIVKGMSAGKQKIKVKLVKLVKFQFAYIHLSYLCCICVGERDRWRRREGGRERVLVNSKRGTRGMEREENFEIGRSNL